MTRRITALLFACVLFTAPAWAQTYVAGAIGADVARSFESSTVGIDSSNGNGEVINWGLRAGTSLGSIFGVELEFVRPGEFDTDNSRLIAVPLAASLAAIAPGLTIFPTPQVQTSQRTTSWNTVAWVRKTLTSFADLVFLGGLGFSRVVEETEVSFRPLPSGAPTRLASTRTISYDVGPVVGAEARLHLTEHVQLTPGLRLQSLGTDFTSGLLLRPSVALGWSF
jgi:hypothetical protein